LKRGKKMKKRKEEPPQGGGEKTTVLPSQGFFKRTRRGKGVKSRKSVPGPSDISEGRGIRHQQRAEGKDFIILCKDS